MLTFSSKVLLVMLIVIVVSLVWICTVVEVWWHSLMRTWLLVIELTHRWLVMPLHRLIHIILLHKRHLSIASNWWHRCAHRIHYRGAIAWDTKTTAASLAE